MPKEQWCSQRIDLEKRGDGWEKYTLELWVYEGATGFEFRIFGTEPEKIENVTIVRQV